jgi:AcrR family transcriptional regulator
MIKETKPTKREVTREKVINAAIDCIYRDGFNAAHTNRIAEEAGVSWGVLQYHFSDKDGLLQAVIDHIFDEFATTLESTSLQGDDLQQRVRQLIDVVWTLVSKKEYRVSIAILRNAGKDNGSTINGQKQLSRWAKKPPNCGTTFLRTTLKHHSRVTLPVTCCLPRCAAWSMKLTPAVLRQKIRLHWNATR